MYRLRNINILKFAFLSKYMKITFQNIRVQKYNQN